MAVHNPLFKAPEMPDYIPYDRNELQRLGVKQDRTYYGLSDSDFRKRHKPLLSAEKLFETQTLKDQTGNTELMPALQGEFMRAGIGDALAGFGDPASVDGAITGGTLAPGSAAEASVARALGNSVEGEQQRNRANRLASLTTAESLFPRRSFGLSGSDVANLEIANTAGLNNWNQADYATQFQTDQYNYLVQAQNRAADAAEHNQGIMANAQKRGAIWSGIFNSLGSLVGAAGSAAGGAGGICWVAREIFGNEEIEGMPTWIKFRTWMLANASPEFLQAYIRNGPTFARYLRNNPAAKAALRPVFENYLTA
jgi:DNA polymerase III psi subunit